MKWLGRRTAGAKNHGATGKRGSTGNEIHAINKTKGSEVAGRLEVADNASARSKGLLGRSGLAQGAGLWIIPCESVHTFWMKFSIDLIYLDRALRVRKVRECVRPWRMSACLTAHSVIELPCGTIRNSQTSLGDQLEFSDRG
jgi:uncharacterized protein